MQQSEKLCAKLSCEQREALLQAELLKKTQQLFSVYSKIDFAELACMINDDYCQENFMQNDIFDSSKYIDVSASDVEPADMQKLVKGMCDTCLLRYLLAYQAWLDAVGSHVVKKPAHYTITNKGICVTIAEHSVSISYIPVAQADTDDDCQYLTAHDFYKETYAICK